MKMLLATRGLLAFVLLLASSVPGSGHKHQSCPSFEDFARVYGTSYFEQMASVANKALGRNASEILPLDVHDCRKSVLKMRDFLDVFAPVYHESTWLQLRKELDYGYEAIGRFHDLDASNSIYTPDEMISLRNDVLHWYTKLFVSSPKKLAEYRLLLSHPKKEGPLRIPKDASKFFWGYFTPHGVPSSKLNGLENMQGLLHAQLTFAKYMHDVAAAMPEMISIKAHTTFHDFRKIVRSILDVNALFSASPFIENNKTAKALEDLKTTYTEYGALNDVWNAYVHAKGEGDNNRAIKLEEQVQHGWMLLKEMQKQLHLVDDFHTLKKHMTTDCMYPNQGNGDDDGHHHGHQDEDDDVVVVEETTSVTIQVSEVIVS